MNTVAVNGTLRTETGKKATKVVRRSGQVPGVIYGGEENVHFSAETLDFRDLVYTPNFNLADITIDGKVYQCILKSASFHPVTDDLEHLDFLLLVPGRTVKVDLPVRFRGASPGVKAGGKIVQKLRKVTVKTTPEALVDALYTDISELELGHSTRVRDIELPDGMQLMNPAPIPVATIEIPRALKSAAAQKDAEDQEAD